MITTIWIRIKYTILNIYDYFVLLFWETLLDIVYWITHHEKR